MTSPESKRKRGDDEEGLRKDKFTLSVEPTAYASKPGALSNKKLKTSTSTKPDGKSPQVSAFIQSPALIRLQRQLHLGDLQDLILYLLGLGKAPMWLGIPNRSAIKKIVILLVPGLDQRMIIPTTIGYVESTKTGAAASPDHYYPVILPAYDLEDHVKALGEMFPVLWPVLTPADSKGSRVYSPIDAILTVRASKDATSAKTGNSKSNSKEFKDEPTPMEDFIATQSQLEYNYDFVLHPDIFSSESERESNAQARIDGGQSTADGWVDTTSLASSTNASTSHATNKSPSSPYPPSCRPFHALDCEMCQFGESSRALTRLTLLSSTGEPELDMLVKPEQPITDYLTKFSGITPKMLEGVTTTLADAQQALLKKLKPDSILIGHSIDSDLAALKMSHHSIVDTTMLYPHPRGSQFKNSLRFLATTHLHRTIQAGTDGHDPMEDARAALDLAKLKCAKGPLYGTHQGQQVSLFERLADAPAVKEGVKNYDKRNGKYAGALVDWGHPSKGHGRFAAQSWDVGSDEEVVARVHDALYGDEASGIQGGEPFIWARMRELQALKGYWTNVGAWDDAEQRDSVRKQYLSNEEEDEGGCPGLDGGKSQELKDASGDVLKAAVQRTVQRIKDVYDDLPTGTAFMVYSGGGDRRELDRLTAVSKSYKTEMSAGKSWSHMTAKWTGDNQQKQHEAFAQARSGLMFLTVKQ